MNKKSNYEYLLFLAVWVYPSSLDEALPMYSSWIMYQAPFSLLPMNHHVWMNFCEEHFYDSAVVEPRWYLNIFCEVPLLWILECECCLWLQNDESSPKKTINT